MGINEIILILILIADRDRVSANHLPPHIQDMRPDFEPDNDGETVLEAEHGNVISQQLRLGLGLRLGIGRFCFL